MSRWLSELRGNWLPDWAWLLPAESQGEQQAYFIWIKRWLCKICHCTLSVIPNFLLPYRHYLVRVVQMVVVAFYES